jgi:hypothetical protein
MKFDIPLVARGSAAIAEIELEAGAAVAGDANATAEKLVVSASAARTMNVVFIFLTFRFSVVGYGWEAHRLPGKRRRRTYNTTDAPSSCR